MPAEIPIWWLLLSGLFFLVNIVFFSVLTFVAWKLLEVGKKVEPKIESLLSTVNAIGHKVDDLTAIVKDVASKVGQQAQGVSASANQISHVAAEQVERFGPIIAAATAAYKVIGTARQLLFFRAIGKSERKGIERAAARKR